MASVRPAPLADTHLRADGVRPWEMYANLWRHRGLVRDFAVRRIAAQYRGSGLGILWAILLPLCMVTVYSFVFSVIFRSDWGNLSNSKLGFALIMFCGMAVYQLFAESLGSAPGLMASHANYVKKVVFPLEILPLANVLAALFHTTIALAIILLGAAVVTGTLSVKIVALPLLLLPVVLLSAGVSWFLSSLGVYVRDCTHAVTVVLQVLYFLSPVFYPISQVPRPFQQIMLLNPLASVMEDARAVVFGGEWPHWPRLALVTFVCLCVAHMGYAWFMRTRRGFADVL